MLKPNIKYKVTLTEEEREFLHDLSDTHYSDAKKIVLVMDNLR